jgi:uncharacterized protein YfdQ (DUF2303 family)
MTQINTVETTNTGAKALVDAGVFSVTCEDRVVTLRDDEENDPVVATVDKSGEVSLHRDLTRALRQALPHPTEARGSLKLARVEDLVEFTKRFKLSGTVIFAVSPAASLGAPAGFTAISDYSSDADHLCWARHRAFVACAKSRKLSEWNRSYTQAEFADLIDDWADKVVSIPGAPDATAERLLQMASDLEVEENRVSKVTREPKTRLFAATLKEGATAKTTIYPRFGISLPLFDGRSEKEVEVRLRLEKSGGEYGFVVSVHNLDQLLADEFRAMAEELEKEAGVPVWQGAPPEEMSVGI